MSHVRSNPGGLARWALLLLALVGASACAPNPDADQVESSSALAGIAATTSLGNLSLAFGEDSTHNAVGVWRDINRLSTGVWSQSGDAMQINVSAKLTGKGSVWLRAWVDGQLALPSDVQFFSAGAATTSQRSFTFLLPKVTAGFHLVRVQWLSGDSYTMTERSLAIRSVPSVPGTNAQLSLAVPASGPAVHVGRTAGSWATIPGLTTTMATRLPMNLQISFAAEMGVGSTRFLARALVDGAPAQPGDITMEEVDHQSEGTRSMVFSSVNVPPGAHTIVIQWYCDTGGDIWVGDRTLSVYGTYSGARIAEGGASAAVTETAPETITNSNWLTASLGIIDVGSTPGSGVMVSASLEHLQSAGTGALHVRARLDDRVMSPAEYVLDREGRFDTQTLVFSTKDFTTANYHAITLEYHVDDGTTAQVRDIDLVASAVRRTGADFAQAQPYENPLTPHYGTFNLLTICLDPMRPNEPPLTDSVVNDVVDGADGGISIRGLYAEMTGGRFDMNNHWTLGCGTPSTYHPPVEHQGNWYWDNHAFAQMRQDAIAAADPDFDFAQFDLNHDGRVTADELDINICIPQTSPSGQAEESGSYQVDGTTLTLSTVDCYMSPNLSDRAASVGVIAHENGHQLLSAYDLYGPIPMPDQLTLMGSRQPIHMSAYEKLHHGWVSPALIDLTSWTTKTLDLEPVETGKEVLILYDPTRTHDEYFVIENRSTSASLGITNYDRYLAAPGGLTLWHIVENPALLNPNIPPPVPNIDPAGWAARLAQYGWVAGGIQRWGTIQPSAPISLVWSDGTPANITVSGVANDPSGVTITKLVPWRLHPIALTRSSSPAQH
ncbi:MAG: hypothetical protein ACHP7M_11810 [Burkholderiales bacterium]